MCRKQFLGNILTFNKYFEGLQYEIGIQNLFIEYTLMLR